MVGARLLVQVATDRETDELKRKLVAAQKQLRDLLVYEVADKAGEDAAGDDDYLGCAEPPVDIDKLTASRTSWQNCSAKMLTRWLNRCFL